MSQSPLTAKQVTAFKREIKERIHHYGAMGGSFMNGGESYTATANAYRNVLELLKEIESDGK